MRPERKAWIVQTHEGTGLAHFYASVIAGLGAPTSGLRSVARLAEQVDALFRQLRPRMLDLRRVPQCVARSIA